MNSKHSWMHLLPLIALVMVLVIGTTGAKTEGEWIWVKNGSQGYTLYCPPNAIARRYDPEGILHIELLDYQVLTIRVHANYAHLSAEQWTDAWLSNNMSTSASEVSEQVPVMPVAGRSYINIEKQLAETMILIGPAGPQRRTIFASNSYIYIVDYPLGHTHNEDIFEQIVASFNTGEFLEDSGFEEIKTDSTQVITALQVPYYSQRDARWICDQLGTCNCNFNTCTSQTYTAIGDAGCFITSQAMIFQYYTGNDFKNPQEFDTCLTNNGGYGSWSGCAYGVCGASYSPPSACRPSSVTYVGYSTDLALLDSDLNNGSPAIAWVDGGAHYVVVIGKSGGTYQINDPYYSRSEITPGEIQGFVRYQGPVPTSGTSWNFAYGLQGWIIGNGLNNQQQLSEGMWFNVSANDPYLIGPMIDIAAEDYSYVYVKIASQTDNCGQIYFQRQGDAGFTHTGYVSLPIIADGGDNHLFVDMTQNSQWTGDITRLRLDPACQAVNNHAVRIDRIRLLSDAPISTDRLKPLLRYWNEGLTGHFYTSRWEELGLGESGWNYEQFEGYVAAKQDYFAPNMLPLYRFWHPDRQKHFYTTSESEKAIVEQQGFVYQGITGYVLREANNLYQTLPLYRCYNAQLDNHFYTTSWSEVQSAVNNYGYIYERTEAYVFGAEALNLNPSSVYLPLVMR